MIVRHLDDVVNTERQVKTETWDSVRMSLKDDNVGYSFHITTIYAGTETPIWYQNHYETVFCMSGEGEIETCDDGKVYPITPGMMYVLDRHDKHLLRAKTEMKMACVFNPPLNGKEVHDENGVYPLEAAAVAE
jgi:L-ectoine synthase